jgi:hypothetical protein
MVGSLSLARSARLAAATSAVAASSFSPILPVGVSISNPQEQICLEGVDLIALIVGDPGSPPSTMMMVLPGTSSSTGTIVLPTSVVESPSSPTSVLRVAPLTVSRLCSSFDLYACVVSVLEFLAIFCITIGRKTYELPRSVIALSE